MKQIKLRVRKKTLVPTKRAIINKYRSDWKLVWVLDYNDSINFFKQIKTDAQFGKFLLDNFGNGIYSALIFRKGQEGFKSFIKIECKEDYYIRLQRKETSEQKEKRSLSFEQRRLQRLMKREDEMSEEQKDNINKSLEEVEEELSFSKELLELEKREGSCYPYLKTILPIFKPHSYDEILKEDYNKEKEVEKQEVQIQQNKQILEDEKNEKHEEEIRWI